MLIAGGLAGLSPRPSSGHRLQPQLPELRHLRDRRDHRRPARPGLAGRRGPGRAAVWRAARGRPAEAGDTEAPVDIVQVNQAMIVMFVAAQPLIGRCTGSARPAPKVPARSCPRDGTLDDARRHGTDPAQRQPPVRRAGHLPGAGAGRHPGLRQVRPPRRRDVRLLPAVREGDGAQPEAARGGDRVRAGCRDHRPRRAAADGPRQGRAAGQHRPGPGLLRDLAAVLGLRGVGGHVQCHQPAPGHAGRLDPADPGRAGRVPVRTLRRDQHRDRGPAPAGRVRGGRSSPARSACSGWA